MVHGAAACGGVGNAWNGVRREQKQRQEKSNINESLTNSCAATAESHNALNIISNIVDAAAGSCRSRVATQYLKTYTQTLTAHDESMEYVVRIFTCSVRARKKIHTQKNHTHNPLIPPSTQSVAEKRRPTCQPRLWMAPSLILREREIVYVYVYVCDVHITLLCV